MEKECLIIALLYIERILFATPAPLHGSFSSERSSTSFTFYITSLNWRAFCMSALLVASKTWDDFSMVNSDYVQILSNAPTRQESSGFTMRPFSGGYNSGSRVCDIARVNQLEAKLLALIGFNICVTGEDYAR